MTQNEQKLIEYIRELRPFETITIQKDANGKPDYYIIKREQKIFITELS